jgi:bisphosphoglycerate-dependent phosphoglycerate mutase
MSYIDIYKNKNDKFDAAVGLANSSHSRNNDEHYSDDHPNRANEIRANWGEAGVMLACPDYATGKNGIYTDVKDALGNIAHFCHRAGLDVDATFEAALAAYGGDFEDGMPASHNTDKFPSEG